MKTILKKAKAVVLKGDPKYSIQEIASAVDRDSRGQLNVESRLATNDVSVAFELIAVALYKAMRRRGVSHVQALKSTEELIFITDIKVVM